MKFYNIHRIVLLVSVLLPLLTACGGTDEPANASIEKPEKVVPVEVEIASPIDLEETFTLPAGLEAWEDLVLSAEVSGPVKRINYREGQRVEAGAILLEIDPETLQSQLAREEENFAASQRKLQRYRKLRAEGLVSEQELDGLENSLTAAEVALRTIRLQLARCYPKAPVSGFVDRHFVDRGEYVDPGKALLRLVQVDKLKAIADVPEKDVPFLKVGQQVEIVAARINNQPAELLTGTIEHIAYSAETTTRTYRTKIVIDNSGGTLRPGMIVRARFLRQKLEQVLTVPLYSVLDRDGDKILLLAEQDTAREVSVMLGNSVGDRVHVLDGLRAGQHVVVKGQQLLTDGAKISIKEQ